MVQRLSDFGRRWYLAFVITLSVLASACGELTQPVPLVVKDFCSLTEDQLPIILSRKDSELTKRQVAELNELRKRICK